MTGSTGAGAYPWFSEYPPGVPQRINENAYASLADVLERRCAKFGNAPADECMGEHLDFAALDRLPQAFASYMQSVPGLHQRHRVPVMIPNLLEKPVPHFSFPAGGPALA